MKNLTKVVTTAIDSSIPIITNTPFSPHSPLQDVSQMISSNTSNIITSLKNSNNPLKTMINTLSSNPLSTLTKITNSLLNRHILFIIFLIITPLLLFLFTTILVLVGIVMLLLMPLISITSPIWIPTATLFLLVTVEFLSVCGFVIVMVVTLFSAYRSWFYIATRNLLPIGAAVL